MKARWIALRAAASTLVALSLVSAALTPAAAAQTSTYLRQIVADHAPIVIQETGDNDGNYESVNHLLRIDFDGNLSGADNYFTASAPNLVTRGQPTVYYSIVETGSSSDYGAYYIGYYFYHPRDGGSPIVGPAVDPGHPHDLEGIWMIVPKTAYSYTGTRPLILTQAHSALIPYADPQFFPGMPFPSLVGNGKPFIGAINYWQDPSGHPRPVVAVRAGTHGTYMAQKCCSAADDYYDGNGMDPNRGPGDPFVARVHYGSDALIYVPDAAPCTNVINGCGSQRVPYNVGHGTYWYDLIGMSDALFWDLREDPRMFSAPTYDLGQGLRGNESFAVYNQSEGANPPWMWTGGRGECHAGICWYSFGVDGSLGGYGPINWPSIPYGSLLTNPASVADTYFPFIPWSHTTVNNPFLGPSNPTPPPPAPGVSIAGPQEVVRDEWHSWTAHPAGGTPPYTYQWSGVLTGSDQTITGGISSSESLYLDVWDATGVRLSVVSIWITVSEPLSCDPYCTRPPPVDSNRRPKAGGINHGRS